METLESVMSRAMDMIEAKANERHYVASDHQVSVIAGRMVDAGYLPYDREAFSALAGWLALYKLDHTRQGVMLTGETGTGKTMFLRKFIGKPITAAEAVDMKQTLSLSSFRSALYGEHRDEYIKIKPGGCVIDDLGQEKVSMSYGNKEEVMESVICDLYRIWQDGSKSHFSTNLDMGKLSKRYGRRVIDRLREMCFIVEMKGASARQ